ncbi:SusC/RagA family TonB-linked outer membrane protein [Marinilabiliaceae bacterium JC017]|nr:SusC/RagA family TonB-linked outer membrane protein [Marinilabiliaceae bacterium JC017]
MRRLALILSLIVFMGVDVILAQTKTITGKVTSSEDGEPIPGVSVVVRGTTIGTITRVDGMYSLSVPEDATNLLFSFVGMITQDITIQGRSVINVVMDPETIGVEEVIVTALGIKRESKALGYAVQDVKSEELTKSSNANLVNSISGKVAGVQVTSSSGVAGGSSFVTIRGAASITGNNQPLFVVDGIPINNDQNYSGNPDDGQNNLTGSVGFSNRAIDLNPEDIESMSVLKGGAATSLYGLRAANGAIIITTKKGKMTDGKTVNVSFNSSVRVDKISQVPELQDKYSQGYDGEYHEFSATSWGAPISELEYDGATDYKWSSLGHLVPKGSTPGGKAIPAKAYDHFDFFQTGLTFNNSISISGGGKDGTFYMSVGNLESKGVVPENEFSKYSFMMSGEFKATEKFKFLGSANYIHSGGVRVQQGSNTSGVMLGLLRCSPTFDNSDGYEFEDGRQRSYRGYTGYDNPYWTVNNNQLRDRVDRLIGNVGFEWDIIENLKLRYKLGIDVYTDKRKLQMAIHSNDKRAGQIQEDEHFNRDINSDLILSYNKELSSDLNFTAMGGWNMYDTYYQQVYVQGDGLTIPKFYHMSNTATQLVRETVNQKRTAAFYADLGIGYKNMLFLNATGRNEWSTTLPEANNSFFYPSVNAGFVFSELPVFDNFPALSFGKLRTSYSILANDAFLYATETYYEQAAYGDGSTDGISFPFNGQPGFIYGDVKGNDKLKPEKLKSFEVGLDVRFFQNRLGLDVTYYDNKNEDLILSVPISGTSGYTNIVMNAASMYNKGIEFVLNGTPIKTPDFSWDILVNFTKNKNEVTELAEGVPNVSLGGFTSAQMRAIVGRSYGSIYGTKWKRNDAGELLIDDNGYQIKDDDMVFLGDALPEWTMGLTNTFSYKGITLSGLLDFKQGGKVWNGTKNVMKYFGTHQITEDRTKKVVLDGIVESTGQRNTKEITLDETYYGTHDNGWDGVSEPVIEDAGWIRLREVSLVYQLPKSLISKIGLGSASVSFTGNNLILITDYTGVDPETSLMGAHNAQGLDYFNMPGTKSYIFGLKVNF